MITFTFFRQFLAVLEHRGLDTAQVLAQADIKANFLEDPNARMSIAEHDRLWALLLKLTPASMLALKAGDTLAPASLSSLVYLAMSFEDGLQALQSLIANKNTGSDIKLMLDINADNVTLSLSDEYQQLKYSNHFLCLAVQHILDLLFWLSKKTIHPVKIEMRQAADAKQFSFIKDYQACLRQTSNKPCLVFNKSDLIFKLAGNNQKIRLLLERESKAELALYQASSSFSEAVKTQLNRCFIDYQQDESLALFKNALSLKAISECFCMTERTLQRKLKQQETNFSALLDEVRNKHIQYYQERGKNLTDISVLCGFADTMGLVRFMKRTSR